MPLVLGMARAAPMIDRRGYERLQSMARAREQDFTKFYYDKVATGEGCGCAERVIDVHDAERLAGKPVLHVPLRFPKRGDLRRFLAKAGLTSRPASR